MCACDKKGKKNILVWKLKIYVYNEHTQLLLCIFMELLSCLIYFLFVRSIEESISYDATSFLNTLI